MGQLTQTLIYTIVINMFVLCVSCRESVAVLWSFKNPCDSWQLAHSTNIFIAIVYINVCVSCPIHLYFYNY